MNIAWLLPDSCTVRGDRAVFLVGKVGYEYIAERAVLEKIEEGTLESVVCRTCYDSNGIPSYFAFDDLSRLELFEDIISTPGVGPIRALRLMNSVTEAELLTAVNEGKTSIITKTKCGIGTKGAKAVLERLKEVGFSPSKVPVVSSRLRDIMNELGVEIDEQLLGEAFSKHPDDPKAGVAYYLRKKKEIS